MWYPKLYESDINFYAYIFLLFIFSHTWWDSIIYKAKILYIYFNIFFCPILALPVAIFLPCHVQNCDTISHLISKHCSWMVNGIELRGEVEKVPHRGGGVIVMNHQHACDIVVTATTFPVFCSATLVVKSSLKWVLLIARLCGAHFVESSPGASAQDVMSKGVADKAKENAKILVYPEGTRNKFALKTQCFLPFKKGPFRAAISSQVPVIPLVTSPMYFAIGDRNFFSKGSVITEVLEPISTVGMVDKDADELLIRVRKLMKEKYLALRREVFSKLPDDHPVFEYITDNGEAKREEIDKAKL